MNDGDELVQVVPTNGDDDIFLASRRGQAIRFHESDVRPMGRTAAGVIGMKFRGDDHLVSCDVLSGDVEYLTITSEGYGKRTDPEEYSTKKRGGLGVRAMKVSAKKGEVVGAMFVQPEDEILLISTGGVVIRTSVDDISVQGRDAGGVTVMSLDNGDSVSAVARLLEADEEDDDAPELDADADLDVQGLDDTDLDADDPGDPGDVAEFEAGDDAD